LVSLFLAFVPVQALAGNPLARPVSSKAREHLDLGNKLYGVRSFDEAAAEYKAGELIEPAPVFDYNLGQCFRQLGKYQEAIWHYERFLTRGDPHGEILDAVNSFITQMKGELSKRAMTQPPTEPAPSVPPASSASSQGAPPPQASRHDIEPWYSDRLGWTLAGIGLLGVGIGGALIVTAKNLNDEANSSKSQREYERIQDRASTRNVAGIIVGAGGTALLATGIFRLAFHSPERTSLVLAPSRNGLIVQGNF
jgi:tetratricopeptide (TPR) repeat protein